MMRLCIQGLFSEASWVPAQPCRGSRSMGGDVGHGPPRYRVLCALMGQQWEPEEAPHALQPTVA